MLQPNAFPRVLSEFLLVFMQLAMTYSFWAGAEVPRTSQACREFGSFAVPTGLFQFSLVCWQMA